MTDTTNDQQDDFMSTVLEWCETELTSQQAAARIGVSRPYLCANVKAWRMVGNRRRYRPEDVDAHAVTLLCDD